jgi:FAD synthetase
VNKRLAIPFADLTCALYSEQIALSFNGGKDCTVILHMLRALSLLNPGGEEPVHRRIKYVHFVKDNEFDEIKSFREAIEVTYGIQVQLFSADFKGQVQRLIDEQGIKAIIMGNRRTDPYSADLTPICKSSAGWPEFTRIFPILDWCY